MVAVNVILLVVLLVPVELVFGTWIRPMAIGDLKRFSIPIGVTMEFDTSKLYTGGRRNPARYTRDEWGLRGSHRELKRVDLLTVGGSTTEQRYLDDEDTWQEVARRELMERGRPMVLANAGVDGQSTVGHRFNFDYWFPLLTDLHPRVILFYVGANDVLRHQQRIEYDEALDGRSWRIRSATYQILRTVRSNLRAHSVGVTHGRMPAYTDADFTLEGRMSAADRADAARRLTSQFLSNVDILKQRTLASGATPIFMTQTAYGWNADRKPPRGLKTPITIHGMTVNLADVAALHQDLNRGLMDYCEKNLLTCFDLADDVEFDVDDYYDNLHNSPRGAAKIGRYLADQLTQFDTQNGRL